MGLNPEPGNILMLDYESDADEHQARVRAISKGLGIDVPSNIYYRYCYQSIAADIEQVQRHVLDKDIDLVIVDSASPACGGEPESAEATTKCFSALRSLRKAIIMMTILIPGD